MGLSVEAFKPDNVIQLGFEPNRIDLLTEISGIAFEEAFTNKAEGKYGNQVANFISKKDLIASKKASNRPKDKNDLELLTKL